VRVSVSISAVLIVDGCIRGLHEYGGARKLDTFVFLKRQESRCESSKNFNLHSLAYHNIRIDIASLIADVIPPIESEVFQSITRMHR
jgi:hypothetical protein